MTRVETLRTVLGLTQAEMATDLGVDRSAVSRMESGQGESGPVSKLLDALATEAGRPDLTAAEFLLTPRLQEPRVPGLPGSRTKDLAR
jgi:transcriptional regulator with XRE-family HTH domain